MPDFSIKDSLGNPLSISDVKWTSASSILNYAKTESLHLTVVDDFVKRKDQPLAQVAAKPVTFSLSLQHDFQLGSTTPEIDLTPSSKVTLSLNAKAGSDLFDDDSFHVSANVPDGTGYAGLAFTGGLDPGVSGSMGDLSFGIDRETDITFQYLKAFPLTANQPTIGDATSAMLSGFVIPATVADLDLLGVNDVCSVSGAGTLTISGSWNVSVPVNPLASVNLVPGIGSLTVKGGAMAGVSETFTLSGSYQIRVEKFAGGIVRLSYLKEAGTTFETKIIASAGTSAKVGKTDYLSKLLGAIEKGTVDPNLIASLKSDDASAFNSAVSDGVNHSLKASLDLALSAATDQQTAFQYEIQTGLLNAESSQAVTRALKGDLTLLTALEEKAQADGTIAPGVKLLNSVLSTSRTYGATLKINLLGIVNLISLSKLISSCEFLFEPSAGLTIKETAQSEKISAITDPLKKQDALQKALYYSALATTTYVVNKTVAMPDLNCQAVYFTANRNTTPQIAADYASWFAILNLLSSGESAGIPNQIGSGSSSCMLRTDLTETLCEAMFFDGQGNPRPESDYREIGRHAMIALIDPGNNDVDRLRVQFLSDDAKWPQAVQIGPSPALNPLLPLSSTNSEFVNLSALVRGDLAQIVWWADAMQKAAAALHQMRQFLAGRDPGALAGDPSFARQRTDLQKQMLRVVGSSQVRFDKPWGLVCLFKAAGSRGASGEIRAGKAAIARPIPEAVSKAGQ
jgi:hypothetical protein